MPLINSFQIILYLNPKSTKNRRTIALPPTALTVLSEYYERRKVEQLVLGILLSDDSLVFCQNDGQPLRPNSVTRAWATIAARAGVKILRLHDARHTHASLMLKQGIHPKIVQERLGHSTIAMTLDVYSHVTPGLQEAAAVSFDKMFSIDSTEKPNKNQLVAKPQK